MVDDTMVSVRDGVSPMTYTADAALLVHGYKFKLYTKHAALSSEANDKSLVLVTRRQAKALIALYVHFHESKVLFSYEKRGIHGSR